FKPLLIAYLNKLVLLIYSSRGLRLITLRDFFSIFYKAWSNIIRPKLILSAFKATSIWLLNLARILN
ncbi:hypothetical protein K491DRAFT_616098, partial [Lophiostoma macrostomum CBS 122681]